MAAITPISPDEKLLILNCVKKNDIFRLSKLITDLNALNQSSNGADSSNLNQKSEFLNTIRDVNYGSLLHVSIILAKSLLSTNLRIFLSPWNVTHDKRNL